ncbi:hypothetical protein C8Q74DRAFT_1373414 [Fomes fomentarius]|nr:hypothetical protein C8Q74DRAFT_1373414 [Fomes fomentarius]
MRPLPAEILWLIIDAAFDGLDFVVLHWRAQIACACALTSKAILPRARFHLYRIINLYDRSRLPSFARTMAECDDLPLMVKRLRLDFAQFVSQDDGHFDVPFPPHVVARLSNLQSLEIGRHFKYTPPHMPPAALGFAKLFAAACPSLQELSLIQINFNSFADFVDVLWSFPHIRKVTISNLYWPLSTPLLATDLTRLPTTRSNNLTTVELELRVSDMNMFAHVWGANVETLILNPGPFIDDRELSSFLRLEQLQVVGFANAMRKLGKIRSEHLHIIKVEEIVKDEQYESLLAHLTEIDGILSQPMFRSLHRIVLTIIYWGKYYKRQEEAQWVEDVTACLPGLQDRGILHLFNNLSSRNSFPLDLLNPGILNC